MATEKIWTDEELDEALKTMGKFHILGHSDLTKEYDPEHCPFCAGLLRTDSL